jgi:hypothetical protein
MTFRAVTDPPFCDVIALWGVSGAVKPIEAKAARLQAARSETVGFYEFHKMVAAACLYPCDPETPGEDLRELAFACLPEAVGHLVGIIHTARLILSRLAHVEGLRIRARVRAGYEPGRRLARLTGLHLAGADAAGNERWEWRDGQIRRGREIAVRGRQ